MDNNITAELGALRNNLLDLSMRNNLLNYKVSSKRTLEITGMSVEDVYTQLVFKNKSVNLNEILKSSGSAPKEATEKLVYLHNQANSVLEDQGCSTLFLAVGFLQWESKDNVKSPIAPILLIPVELKRTGKNKVFQLSWAEVDAFTSITLQEKLKIQNIFLPDFEMPDDITGLTKYFEEISEAVKHQSGWAVKKEMRVDLFSFKKFVMYKDIDPALWTDAKIETEYPIMGKVFGKENDKFRSKFNPEDVDSKIQPHNMYNVVDADSSQIAVIRDAKDGLCEVVEGPPGTGKSQTIVNLIAESVADGKSVLFVSEKLSALNVVKDRLSSVGLGDICLEMHKTNTRKRYILEEIDKILMPISLEIDASNPMNKTLPTDEELLDSAKSRYSIRYAFNILKNIRDFTKKMVKSNVGDIHDIEKSEISISKEELNEYAKLLREPTEGKSFDNFYMLYGIRERIRQHFDSKHNTMIMYKLSKPETWNVRELNDSRIALLKLIEIAEPIYPLKENKWLGCELDIVLPIDLQEIEGMIKESVKAYEELKNTFDILNSSYSITNFATLNDIKIIVEESEKDNSRIRSVVSAQIGVSEFNELIATLAKKSIEYTATLHKVGIRLNIDFEKAFGSKCDYVPINKLNEKLSACVNDVDSLVFWSQYVNYRNKCMKTKADYLITDFENGKIESGDLLETFEGNYVNCLMTKKFQAHPILKEFIKEDHEGRIETFKQLDKNMLTENRSKVMIKVKDNMRKALMTYANDEAYHTLQYEINKKRKNIAIRKLMSTSGKIIQKIKPCFMMSPVSVAQFIDAKSVSFDIIIFDEASQIKPEDAVGTFLRGKQAIVMGDSKQLPPTDFFDVMINTDDMGDYNIVNMESILAVCRRNFVERRLTWHYRSRHESLIAMSNQEFYNNELKVYPSPIQKNENLGLKFKYMPETVYEKGGVNTDEAKAVAEAVFEHYKNNPTKSLMVGTFNVNQQDAITKEIEKLARKNPDIDLDVGREKFLVKNLETIQGDERDVILLSVGFGFDKDKKLSLNFGALNQNGGERRLNVLMTRAREKCVIFANFRAQDLPLESINSVGLKKLRAFLDFAESGKINMDYDKKIDDESFENAVKAFLERKGFTVHKDIGCSGYKMNLAIPDPNNEGKYILGIECDGENYFSSKVCRDRDRLREQVLVGLGWKIYNVWSTDWYLHPRESRNALLKQVNEIISKATIEASKQTEAPKSVIYL